jgi:hypothetical protein
MAAEIAALAGKATPIEEAVSAYARPSLTTALALDDPRRIELPRRAAHVTRDMIPPDAVAHRLYVSPMFKRFAAACAGQSRVFEYADPLAGLVATVLPPTGTLPWHYDTNEFVLTIMVQAPEEGGRFEYVPALRRPGDENLPGLARVLEGRAEDEIRGADLVPGDLQIFRGRYTLHRVTPVKGRSSRIVVVFSYADRPGVIGPVDRTRAVSGRVTEAHLVAEEFARTPGDGLIF